MSSVLLKHGFLGKYVSSEEISFPAYLLQRRDRNRHGGGVLMYTRVTLQVKLLQPPDLEFLMYIISVQW